MSSHHTHDGASTCKCQVGGASGLPAAQSGPPSTFPGLCRWLWWAKLSPKQPTPSTTPALQSATAMCSQDLSKINVHTRSWNCGSAREGSTAYPSQRAPPLLSSAALANVAMTDAPGQFWLFDGPAAVGIHQEWSQLCAYVGLTHPAGR